MPTLWYKSRSIEWDVGPYPAVNAQAFFFLGGVEGSPITVYSDAGENEAHPNPVVADGNGRWPAVYIPYMASYGVRVLNEANVQLWLDDLIPNPNPVEIDVDPPPTGGVETGMFFWMPVQGIKTGYVRANGRTIGNAASSATERSHDDTEALFTFLWNSMADAQAPVIPSRGSSALADFTANRQITLPDMRGSIPVGLDDMGSTPLGSFTGATFNHGSATIAGSFLGVNVFGLTPGMLPSHNHTGTTVSAGSHDHGGVTGNDSPGHVHAINLNSGFEGAHTHSGSTDSESGDHAHAVSGTTDIQGAHQHTVGISGGAGGVTSAQSAVTNVANTVTTSSAGSHAHNFSVTSGGRTLAHTHAFNTGAGSAHLHAVIGNTANPTTNHTHTIGSAGAHTHTFTTSNTGSGESILKLPRSYLGTWYVRL
jgi:hypothetical protein